MHADIGNDDVNLFSENRLGKVAGYLSSPLHYYVPFKYMGIEVYYDKL